MSAENEARMDEYEMLAVQAMMIEKAHRTKRPKLSDLFSRPNGDKQFDRKSIDEQRRESDEVNKWLSTLVTVDRKG
jgi:hypothetical protein